MSSRTLRSSAGIPSQSQTSSESTARKRKNDTVDQNPKQPKARKATGRPRHTNMTIHNDHDEIGDLSNKPKPRQGPKATAAAAQTQERDLTDEHDKLGEDSNNPNPARKQPKKTPASKIAAVASQAARKPKAKPNDLGSRTRHQKTTLQTKSSFIKLTETIGDLFTAPKSTLLIHACNTRGTWGAGIAQTFRLRYPNAYKVYTQACDTRGTALLGKALLIEPQRGSKPCAERLARHYIGCLFTSVGKGKGKGTPGEILRATGTAVESLLWQIGKVGEAGGRIGEVRMPRINSGLFRVKWEDTREVLEGFEVGESGVREIRVVSREEDG